MPFQCLCSEKNVRVFASALLYLGKCGASVTLEATSEEVRPVRHGRALTGRACFLFDLCASHLLSGELQQTSRRTRHLRGADAVHRQRALFFRPCDVPWRQCS